MSNETVITVEGNLVAEPELKFTPSGAAVASFTIASTPRIYDKDRREWIDGQALFLNCSAWRTLAENVAESLTRGSRVIARGELKQRSYETKQGDKRTVIELHVSNIGPSLISAVAKVEKTSSGKRPAKPVDDDPWTSAPADTDNPPF